MRVILSNDNNDKKHVEKITVKDEHRTFSTQIKWQEVYIVFQFETKNNIFITEL